LSHRKSIYRIGASIALLLTSVTLAVAQSNAASDAVAKSGADAWGNHNHDGVYTCDEWKKHLDRIFTLADKNHDGVLDQSEFAAVRKADPAFADADFGYFDENQDGKITRDEFINKPSEFIVRFDRNGDCRVTPDELKAATAPKGPAGPVRDRFHTN
jgi:EF-hand domain pair